MYKDSSLSINWECPRIVKHRYSRPAHILSELVTPFCGVLGSFPLSEWCWRSADSTATMDHICQSSAVVPGWQWAALQCGPGHRHPPTSRGSSCRWHAFLWHLHLPVVSNGPFSHCKSNLMHNLSRLEKNDPNFENLANHCSFSARLLRSRDDLVFHVPNVWFPWTRAVNSGSSAVCSFRLAEIKSVFSGNYKVLNRDTLQWSARIQEKVANPGEVSVHIKIKLIWDNTSHLIPGSRKGT